MVIADTILTPDLDVRRSGFSGPNTSATRTRQRVAVSNSTCRLRTWRTDDVTWQAGEQAVAGTQQAGNKTAACRLMVSKVYGMLVCVCVCVCVCNDRTESRRTIRSLAVASSFSASRTFTRFLPPATASPEANNASAVLIHSSMLSRRRRIRCSSGRTQGNRTVPCSTELVQRRRGTATEAGSSEEMRSTQQ